MMAGPLVGDADDERDRQATVTDFLDYTEHLPADCERSLRILRKQDQLCQQSTEELHQLLRQYGRLPPTNDPYESAQLRARISYLLDLIQRRRESSAAEANRLHEEVARHHNRLQSVKAKLLALPQPPSRDPTPQPVQRSPQAKRTDGIRISLKVDRHKLHGVLPQRPRYRRVTVPGEVLPPPNPESPTPSDLDEFEDEEQEDERPPPPPLVIMRKKEKAIKPPKLPKEPKPPRESKSKKDKLPRPLGQLGTNVHSAVAGISTSNALSLLTPPPDRVIPGTIHAPWFRLTEYEMAKLRKRMKKNAIWAPSDTMIRRELTESGRGHEAYQKAKRRAEETGEQLIDEDDVEGQIGGNRPLRPGEISADVKAKTTNKGMSLNVQKKEKKALMMQQQIALAAQQTADLATQKLGSLGASFRTLFDKPGTATMPIGSNAPKSQKRKRDAGASPSLSDLQLQAQLNGENAGSAAKQLAKKLKGTPSSTWNASTTATTIIPKAPPAPSPGRALTTTTTRTEPTTETTSPKDTRRATTSTRPSLILKPPARDPTPAEPGSASFSTRQISRPSSRRASVPPPDRNLTRQSPRLKSATPGPTPTAPGFPTAASRRSKRPAPGPVTANQEGGVAVTVGRRKNAPKKKGRLSVEEGKKQEEYAAEEEIDPDEPRYCICDGVSYGTMVCCENPNCEREWFHLECVRLTEPPARRAKWWCPNCDPNKPQNQKGKR